METLIKARFHWQRPVLGRLIWTLAYLGLGYGFAVVLEASADFVSSLSGLLVSLVILAALGFMIRRNHA